jgi:hypothetical protein
MKSNNNTSGSNNISNWAERRSSVKYLENIKNMAMVKLKVKESIEIFPKEHEDLIRNFQTLNSGSDINLQNNYFTEAKISSSKNTFEDISEFIKSEKKNIKKAKKKISLLGDDRNDYMTAINEKEDEFLSEKKNRLKSSKNLNGKNFKEFYKTYIEELESHIDELLTKNEELEANLNSKSNKIKLPDDYEEKTLECLKFKKFKKITGMFKQEQKEYLHSLPKEDSLKISKDEICENPLCLSNAYSLVDISKAYDKLLLENIKLRRENFELKNKKFS